MIDKLTKTFFDTFGIEPRYEDACTAKSVEDMYTYRKALEEIEGIVKNFGSYAAWQEQRINKILDIINKTKGE